MPASVKPAVRAVVLVTDLLAVAGAALALAAVTADVRGWSSLALLVGIALVFEEGVRRAARLKVRLSTGLQSDMTSVWMITGAIALDGGRAVLLLVAVRVYMWFRQHRPAGEDLYRKLFAAAAGVIGTLAAHLAYVGLLDALGGSHQVLHGLIPVVGAILAGAVANRLPVTAYVLAAGMRGRQLLGSVHDNLIELATLCLGGLVSAAMLYEPWLAVLVLAPMVTLQRGALVRELEDAAITDAKTGLLNAVAWEQLAKREIARADREQQSVSVVIIDIDRFKNVNDRYGHLVGDKVLAGIARELREALRQYDGLGRFGGEEFVAVLPDAGEHDALVVAERVRLRVNQRCIADVVPELAESGRGDERLSVSIGVAVRKADQAELADLLHAADQALYRAKWNGRNQVRLARRGDEIPDVVSI